MTGIEEYIYLIRTHDTSRGDLLPQDDFGGGWVYFILDAGYIIYIGRAKHLKSRLASHHVYNKNKHIVLFVHFFGDAYKDAETEAIREYNPILNYSYKNQSMYKEFGLDFTLDNAPDRPG